VDIREKVLEKLDDKGLEQYLQENGVDLEVISESQREIASVPGDKEIYYDKTGKERENVLVSTSNIKGINRCKDFTWFDLLNYGAAGAPRSVRENDNFNINSLSFRFVLGWLEEKSLEEVKEMYKDTEQIEFKCFKNGDEKEYYLRGEGNHRVVVAKNIGVPEIIARSVITYEYNPQKYTLYLSYEKQKERLKELVKELDLSWAKGSKGKDIIRFRFDRWHGILSVFSYRDDVLRHDFSKIDVMKEEVNSMIDRLEAIKRKARMHYFIYKMFPGKARDLLKKFILPDIEDEGLSHVIPLLEVDRKRAYERDIKT